MSKQFPKPLREALLELLKGWYDVTVNPVALTGLRSVMNAQSSDLTDPRLQVVQLVEGALAQLERQNERLSKLLRYYYLNDKSATEVAQALHISDSNYFKERNTALDKLAAIIWHQEQSALQTHGNAVLLRLDAPTYETLIGIEAHVAQIKEQLVVSAPPWIVAVEGMGGLGKTALADQVMRHLIAEHAFVDFAWITMRQQHLGLDGTMIATERPLQTLQAMVDALAAQISEHDPLVTTLTHEKKLAFLEGRFHQRPHLVAIDNLETLRDLQEWLPLLRRWVNPTKFLLTSREHLSRDGGVFPFTLPELCKEDALTLIRQESTLRNLSHLAAVADAQLLSIYEIVGGNPLAIRLVVGQLYAHDFDVVLDDLIHARGAKAETLYSYLYQQAWSRLDDVARQVWLTMPLLSGDYATVENLGEVSGLAEMEVRSALGTLATQNLINCHGTYNARYYTLHSLTQTFLQEQVARWD